VLHAIIAHETTAALQDDMKVQCWRMLSVTFSERLRQKVVKA